MAQSAEFETEKEIIKTTLSQYLNTNPNSIAAYLKENKGYRNLSNMLKIAIVMEDDSLKKKEHLLDLSLLDYHSDSIFHVLAKRKITVNISDTLYAYKYIPVINDLRNKDKWEQNYQDLLEDFKYNNLARMDTIIGEEYIDLIKKQIDYKGKDKPILTKDLNHSYYEYTQHKQDREDELYIQAAKVYRIVFNKEFTKGCYLFSFHCQDDKICRSFIFIRKENNKWVFVDEYPSWIVDES